MFITDEYSLEASYEENHRVFARAVERTIRALQPRRIFVAAFIPEQRIDVPRIAGLRRYFGEDEPRGVSIQDFSARQSFVRDTFRVLQSKLQFRILDIGARLCLREECIIIRNGASLYADDNHLSNAGARFVQDIFRQIFLP